MSTANPTPIAYCRICGRGLTEETVRDVSGLIYCETCISARMEGATPSAHSGPSAEAPFRGAAPPPPPTPDASMRGMVEAPPSVGLATFLGFIPGAGAMYNGQFMKAFVHIILFFTLGMATDVSEFFGPVVFVFYVYMIVDANKTAKARLYGQPLPDYLGLNNLIGQTGASWLGARAAAADQSGDAQTRGIPVGGVTFVTQARPPIGAIILIGLGVLFLLHNIFEMNFNFMNRLWPVFIIGFGLWLADRKYRCPGVLYLGQMMMPVLIALFGMVLLLGEFHRARLAVPLFLVVIGAMWMFSGTVLKQESATQNTDSSSDSSNQNQQ